MPTFPELRILILSVLFVHIVIWLLVCVPNVYPALDGIWNTVLLPVLINSIPEVWVNVVLVAATVALIAPPVTKSIVSSEWSYLTRPTSESSLSPK